MVLKYTSSSVVPSRHSINNSKNSFLAAMTLDKIIQNVAAVDNLIKAILTNSWLMLIWLSTFWGHLLWMKCCASSVIFAKKKRINVMPAISAVLSNIKCLGSSIPEYKKWQTFYLHLHWMVVHISCTMSINEFFNDIAAVSNNFSST